MAYSSHEEQVENNSPLPPCSPIVIAKFWMQCSWVLLTHFPQSHCLSAHWPRCCVLSPSIRGFPGQSQIYNYTVAQVWDQPTILRLRIWMAAMLAPNMRKQATHPHNLHLEELAVAPRCLTLVSLAFSPLIVQVKFGGGWADPRSVPSGNFTLERSQPPFGFLMTIEALKCNYVLLYVDGYSIHLKRVTVHYYCHCSYDDHMKHCFIYFLFSHSSPALTWCIPYSFTWSLSRP